MRLKVDQEIRRCAGTICFCTSFQNRACFYSEFPLFFSTNFAVQEEYAKQPRWRQVEQKKKALLF
jgi:hypothetical protein